MVAPDLAIEDRARLACERQDYEAAATHVLRGFGPEIYSFLLAQFRGNQARVDEVFSDFAEDFWRGLPDFQWRCTVRAWCYKLARSSASRFRRSPHNQPRRRAGLSSAPFIADWIQHARTSTQPHLRTEIKAEFHKLREKLTRDEQDLLILRVDRELPWRDIAYVWLSAEESSDDERLKRLELTLRQRFTDLKRRLKGLAQDAGLL